MYGNRDNEHVVQASGPETNLYGNRRHGGTVRQCEWGSVHEQSGTARRSRKSCKNKAGAGKALFANSR